MPRRSTVRALCAAALLALLALPAAAQSPGGAGRSGACREDVERHCGDVERGRRQIGRCLQEHRDQLSEACRSQLDERRAQRKGRSGEIHAACAADFEALCPGLEPGRERGRCLREQWDQVSEACRAALPERRGGGPGGGGPGGRRGPGGGGPRSP